MAAEFTKATLPGENDYVPISRFQNTPGIGLHCGCYCPECGARVGARIFESSPSSSCFFHESDNSTCTGGHKETQLHIYIKRIIEEHREIVLPHPQADESRIIFDYSRVMLEKKISTIRPDLILTATNGSQVIIEVTITHGTFNNPEKMKLIHSVGIPAIELTFKQQYNDLQRNDETYEIFYSKHAHSLLQELRSKRWLLKPSSDWINRNTPNQQNPIEKKSNLLEWGVMAVISLIALKWGPKLLKNLFRRKRLSSTSNSRKRINKTKKSSRFRG